MASPIKIEEESPTIQQQSQKKRFITFEDDINYNDTSRSLMFTKTEVNEFQATSQPRGNNVPPLNVVNEDQNSDSLKTTEFSEEDLTNRSRNNPLRDSNSLQLKLKGAQRDNSKRASDFKLMQLSHDSKNRLAEMFNDANNVNYKVNSRLDFAFGQESRRFEAQQGYKISTRTCNALSLEEEHMRMEKENIQRKQTLLSPLDAKREYLWMSVQNSIINMKQRPGQLIAEQLHKKYMPPQLSKLQGSPRRSPLPTVNNDGKKLTSVMQKALADKAKTFARTPYGNIAIPKLSDKGQAIPIARQSLKVYRDPADLNMNKLSKEEQRLMFLNQGYNEIEGQSRNSQKFIKIMKGMQAQINHGVRDGTNEYMYRSNMERLMHSRGSLVSHMDIAKIEKQNKGKSQRVSSLLMSTIQPEASFSTSKGNLSPKKNLHILDPIPENRQRKTQFSKRPSEMTQTCRMTMTSQNSTDRQDLGSPEHHQLTGTGYSKSRRQDKRSLKAGSDFEVTNMGGGDIRRPPGTSDLQETSTSKGTARIEVQMNVKGGKTGENFTSKRNSRNSLMQTAKGRYQSYHPVIKDESIFTSKKRDISPSSNKRTDQDTKSSSFYNVKARENPIKIQTSYQTCNQSQSHNQSQAYRDRHNRSGSPTDSILQLSRDAQIITENSNSTRSQLLKDPVLKQAVKEQKYLAYIQKNNALKDPNMVQKQNSPKTVEEKHLQLIKKLFGKSKNTQWTKESIIKTSCTALTNQNISKNETSALEQQNSNVTLDSKVVDLPPGAFSQEEIGNDANTRDSINNILADQKLDENSLNVTISPTETANIDKLGIQDISQHIDTPIETRKPSRIRVQLPPKEEPQEKYKLQNSKLVNYLEQKKSIYKSAQYSTNTNQVSQII